MSDLVDILDELSPIVLARLALVLVEHGDMDCDDVNTTRQFFLAILAAGQRNFGDEFGRMVDVNLMRLLVE